MIRNFHEMIEEVRKLEPSIISVAVAHDEEVLLSVKAAMDEKIADAILVGDEPKICDIVKRLGMREDIRVIHERDEIQACLKAVSLIHDGEAHVLMKGLVNTSHYLRAVLNADVGLRNDRLLSHLAAYEIPRDERLLFASDTGINICPGITEKQDILKNAIDGMKCFGIDRPYIGILAANEQINPKMQVTVEAAELVKIFEKDQTFKGTIEGPVSLDVAVSAMAAKRKGIPSKIAGKTDLLLFPTVEAGNIWSKSMIHYAKINAAGVIMGATNPIILISRADEAKIKFNSIVMACFLYNCKRVGLMS